LSLGGASIFAVKGGQRATGVVGLAGLAVLLAACFGPAVFGGRQFAFRDAARFYYPLYHRVQDQWAAHQLPLWEPMVNGGTPLLGSPMAAVLYPGKLLFAVVPFAWAMRLYVVAHVVLAFAAMLALARTWRLSAPAAILAGLCYAFGGPVLSTYFNVIYLVGAAWAPLGFRAADRWLRLGRRWGLVELAVVLTMQVLGGDAEAAYITVLCALGYGFGLAARSKAPSARAWFWGTGLAAVAIGWAWVGPAAAARVRATGQTNGQAILIATWLAGILAYLATRQRGHRKRLIAMLLGLAGSSLLAISLAAIQVLPVLENAGTSVRWSEADSIFLYDSSLLPYRALEWIWPNLFGTFISGNRYWIGLLPPADAQRPWPLSLYAGALPLVLALCAAGFRGGPPWRAWMTAVACLTFWASLGEFAGPSRWSGATPTPTGGDDSFYGLFATILPGLRLFRFPYKLLVFTTLALAALAGAGWDRLTTGLARRRALVVSSTLLAFAALVLLVAIAQRERLVQTMLRSHTSGDPVFGPLDARGAVIDLLRTLVHAAVALTSSLALIIVAPRWPNRAGAFAVMLLAFDLTLANAGLVITIPQADFEAVPAVIGAIRASERARASPGPFRVHRLESWVPDGWSKTSSSERLRELVDWEIDTAQPGFGVLHGISYLLTDESETGRAGYGRFFDPAFRVTDEPTAAALGVEAGRPVLYHPRQAFDLWGTAYFILPSFPGGWTSVNRSYAAFLDQTELIYPDLAGMAGPDHREERERWLETQDVQVRRNKNAFPRAWIVHDARLIKPQSLSLPASRDALSARLGFGANSSSHDPLFPPPDLRALAYVETDDPERLAPYLSGTGDSAAESATVRYDGPARAVIDVHMTKPGLVVLADAFDSGWRLTIDGRAAPILRANLLMRAAAVSAGSHTLVFTYSPSSLRIGATVSLAAIAALIALARWARSQPLAGAVP
jgi:hypothetical protein